MTVDALSIDEAIQATVRKRIAALVAEEAEAAKARVLARINDEINLLALQVMSSYDIVRNESGVTIRVRKLDTP